MNGEAASDREAAGGAPVARSRWRWYVGLGAAALVLVAVVAVIRPRPQDDYDETIRDRFVAACTADGGDGVRPTCECLYDRLQGEVPFDRFELIDQTLALQVDSTPDVPLTLPDDVQAMLDGCIAATG